MTGKYFHKLVFKKKKYIKLWKDKKNVKQLEAWN